jgi:hypothetical protein
MYAIQHCFICRPSDSTVSVDAGIEPWTVATLALTATRLDLIHTPAFLYKIIQGLVRASITIHFCGSGLTGSGSYPKN